MVDFNMPKIQIIGDPAEVERASYYLAVGAFIVAWAMLEYGFDLCIAAIYHHAPGGKSFAKAQPLSLSRKLAFFRSALQKIPELQPYVEPGCKLANAIESVGEVRHLVVHSAVGQSEDSIERELRRVVPRISGPYEARTNLTAKDIVTAASVLTKLYPVTVELGRTLVQLFVDKSE